MGRRRRHNFQKRLFLLLLLFSLFFRGRRLKRMNDWNRRKRRRRRQNCLWRRRRKPSSAAVRLPPPPVWAWHGGAEEESSAIPNDPESESLFGFGGSRAPPRQEEAARARVLRIREGRALGPVFPNAGFRCEEWRLSKEWWAAQNAILFVGIQMLFPVSPSIFP